MGGFKRDMGHGTHSFIAWILAFSNRWQIKKLHEILWKFSQMCFSSIYLWLIVMTSVQVQAF